MSLIFTSSILLLTVLVAFRTLIKQLISRSTESDEARPDDESAKIIRREKQQMRQESRQSTRPDSAAAENNATPEAQA